MKNLIQRFIREEEGQDIIEYALLAAFISICAVLIITTDRTRRLGSAISRLRPLSRRSQEHLCIRLGRRGYDALWSPQSGIDSRVRRVKSTGEKLSAVAATRDNRRRSRGRSGRVCV